jgi:hypothetical protein
LLTGFGEGKRGFSHPAPLDEGNHFSFYNREIGGKDMKISKGLKRLIPSEFVGKKRTYEIVDVLATQKSNDKGTYSQYTLQLLGDDKVGDCEIAFLFNRDLNTLIDAFGGDTDGWKGKAIDISARVENHEKGYFRWEFFPLENVA